MAEQLSVGLFDDVHRSAVLSPDGVYRYRLTRSWGDASSVVVWVMLNPSTADGSVDDPTIRRVVDFSRRWGYDRVEVVNLFAFRATDPKELRAARRRGVDIVGPENHTTWREAIDGAHLVMAAWGARLLEFSKPAELGNPELLDFCGLERIHTLGMCTSAHAPRHPLMVRKDQDPEPWNVHNFVRADVGSQDAAETEQGHA